MRGLTLKEPVRVQSMDAFQGGYTPGIGSVTWEEEYAEQWRQGWCALGVYCTAESEGNAAAEGDAKAGRGAGPAGLYSRKDNVLFVRDPHAKKAVATVAHEITHAMQFQNFPNLEAVHLWNNRDLAAAANTATEGDAFVVGWMFDQTNRLYMCSMHPEHAMANHVRWRDWSPESLWAHEGFPHTFGPEYALRRHLEDGTQGANAMLREPPLSTLSVLRPDPAKAVEFFRLPERIGDGEACEPGLRNTAGVVGIWGLLQLHGALAATEELPDFLADWRGDRFLHMTCDGETNDEIAWLSAWDTTEAAKTFAAGYNAIAPLIVEHGGVLGAAARAEVRDRRVVVATPGIRGEAAGLANAPMRSFATFSDWIESDCFPDGCDETEVETGPPQRTFTCPAEAPPSRRLSDWLERVRVARDRADGLADLGDAIDAAGRLATFCAINTARNYDLASACRATYSSISYLGRLAPDQRWGLLPYCATTAELRRWMIDIYYSELPHPLASQAAFSGIHGLGRVARALVEGGIPGLLALATAPPLSTLELLADSPQDVAMARLPTSELAAAGCEVAASHVQGAIGIWNLLIDDGRVSGEELPPFLRGWQGDREFHLRCGGDQSWGWASRWRTASAAAAFAAHIQALSDETVAETAMPRNPRIHDERTVWLLTPSLEQFGDLLTTRTEFRVFDDFESWTAAGCFPLERCNGSLADDAATASTPDSSAAAMPPGTP